MQAKESHRLAVLVGEVQELVHVQEDLDELPVDVLENIALASARFDMIVKRLAAQSSGNRS